MIMKEFMSRGVNKVFLDFEIQEFEERKRLNVECTRVFGDAATHQRDSCPLPTFCHR